MSKRPNARTRSLQWLQRREKRRRNPVQKYLSEQGPSETVVPDKRKEKPRYKVTPYNWDVVTDEQDEYDDY